MELPEVSRALNDWQRMRNYNAELLAEQTKLTKERDALAAQNRELVRSLELIASGADGPRTAREALGKVWNGR